MAGVVTPQSAAWATCSDNFHIVLAGGAPLQYSYPLGVGSSLNALIATVNTVNTAFLTNTASFVSAPSGAGADQETGGAWTRGVGGKVDTSTTSTSRLDPSVSSGRGTCDSTIRQNYEGAQFGFDLGKLNLGASGANIHFGVTAGYFDIHSKEKTPSPNQFTDVGSVLTFPPGQFSSDTQVPFVGLYAAYTQGRFFSDAQLRFDVFRSSLTDPANGLSGETLKANAVSLTGNVGYNVPLAGNWFIEPSAGIVWSRISVDTFDAPGVPVAVNVFGHPGTDIFGRGSVDVDAFDSILGRASLRFGANISAGGNVWQPFATVSVFHEFADDVVTTARQASGTNSPLTISTERVGTYGQFGLGTAIVVGDTGWLGYGRVDYKIGENVEGVSANVGLRYQW